MDRRIKETSFPTRKARLITLAALSPFLIAVFGLLYRISPPDAVLLAADVLMLAIGVLTFWRTHRPSIRIAVVLTLMLTALAILAYTAFFIPGTRITNFAIATNLGGMWLIAHGLGRRVGTDLHCIKCDYPHLDEPYCPECNADWTERNSLVRGRRVKDIPSLTLGSLCLALWLLLAVGPIASSLLSKQIPTPVLMRIASAPGGSALHFFELTQRTLTPAQRDALATMLLDARDRAGKLDLSQDQWLNTASTSGTIAPALADRHLSGMYTLKLAPTAIARVCTTSTAEVVVDTTSLAALTSDKMHLWLAGLWIDDATVSGPAKSWVPIADVYRDPDTPSGKPLAHATLNFTPTTPGRHKLKLVCWLAWFPGPPMPGLNNAIPGSLWSKRVELSTTIDVQP